MPPNERALQVRQLAINGIANVAYDYESFRRLSRGRLLPKQTQHVTVVLREFLAMLLMHPLTTYALRQGCRPCVDLVIQEKLPQ